MVLGNHPARSTRVPLRFQELDGAAAARPGTHADGAEGIVQSEPRVAAAARASTTAGAAIEPTTSASSTASSSSTSSSSALKDL